MKTTIFGVLLDVTPDQDTVLRRLMRKYGFMLRFAFQRLVGGLQNIGGLERHCASETELPLRYAKDAVQEAQDLIRARRQAMKDGATLWTQRVKKTRERLTALRASPHPNARRIAGQERKLAYQETRRAFYQQHVEAGTFPPVVFGTKERWLDRFKVLDDPVAEQERSRRYRYLTQVYHRISEQKRRKQRDCLHKASAFLAQQAERAIVLGDLSQQQMVQKSQNVTKRTKGLHRSVQNEWGFYQFVQMVQYKAQRNGKKVYIISERYTSTECSGCGYRQEMPLWKRTYHCPQWGLVMDRDDNAARNILARFLARLGPYPERDDVLSESSGI